MIILGIDPGIATIGFGIVEAHRSSVVSSNMVSSPPRRGCLCPIG